MSNVISWADAVEALKAISEEQKLVSGMSVGEAATALKYTKTASGLYIKTVMTTSAESAVGSTAAGVATEGASAATTTAVNLTLVEGAGGTAEVAGIGAVALPVAACMLASAGGYLIGKKVSEDHPEFFRKLLYPIFDFVTGQHIADGSYSNTNAPSVAMIYDKNGNAYMNSQAINAVANYLNNLYNLPRPSLPTFPIILGSPPEWYKYSGFSDYVPGDHFIACRTNDRDDCLVVELYSYPGSRACFYQDDEYPQFMTPICCKNGIAGQFFNTVIWLKGYAEPRTEYPYDFTGSQEVDTQQVYFNEPLIFTTQEAAESYVLTGKVSSMSYIYNLPTGMIIDVDGSIGDGIPNDVVKYTPTVPSNSPLNAPNGTTWKSVFLPSTTPNEMPESEPVPEVAPSPERLTPYIRPIQPQPTRVPMIIPVVAPISIPIFIPSPEPITSTEPYPLPNPSADPSQLADTPADLPLPENIPDPVNGGSTTIPIVPSIPSPSSAKGLLHVYNPTSLQIDQFGEWLWTTFSGDIIDTVGKLFNNPMDAVIGLHEIYCTPAISGSDMNIRAGFLESNVPSRLVTSRYAEIKCGALSVPEYWGNYLDYSPYTKSYCYLPFIGIVELNTDDIVGSGVEITYRVDVYNGSCIALITTAKPNSDECITYQFEGNCSVSVPITSGMMTAAQNALIGVATTALSAATTAAVTVATGGTALPASVLAGSVAAGATKQGVTSKNQVQYSGSFGSSFGAMGLKVPFLIIKRPRQKVAYGYNTNYGYPAHKMVLVSACTGYLRAIEANVISPTATEAEKKMIETLLKSGVFIN